MPSKYPVPGPIALRAIVDAISNIGVQEDPEHTNHGQFVEEYLASVDLAPGNPWCLAFQYFRVLKAAQALGKPMPPILKTGYTPAEAQWFQGHGLWIPASAGRSQAMRGDLVFFYHPSMGRIAHVGSLSANQVSAFQTVEGNTNNDGDRDGYEVCAKTHAWADIHPKSGFGRMPW